MAAKVPGFFKETYSEKKFDKKILGRVHIESGKKLLLSIYDKVDGEYRRKEEISQADIKKLKDLKKSIKKNKGSVRVVKLTVVLVLVAAGVIFSVFFKNPLMDRALERGMEDLFGAQVDIESVVFEPLQGRISFASLMIADRDDPFMNLIEMGETAIELDVDELMMRRFVADRIVAKNVDWGTVRETSGALDTDGSGAEAGDGEGDSGDGLLGGISLPDIDPEEMVRAELDNLKSVEKLSQLNDDIAATTATWQDTLDQSTAAVNSVSDAVDTVRGFNPREIDTVDEARQLLQAIQTSYSEIAEVRSDVSSTAQDITGQWNRLQDERDNLQTIIAEDRAYLKSKLSLPEGGVTELVAGVAEPYLREALGKYYTYGEKALGIMRRLKDNKEDPEEADTGKRRGSRVTYPGTVNPALLIREMAFSKGSNEEYAGFLNYVSSDQELSGQPTSFGYKQGTDILGIDVSGLIDLRESAAERLALTYASAGSDFEIDSLPETTGLSGLKGILGMETTFRIVPDGGNTGVANLQIGDPSVSIATEDEVSTVLSSILSSADSIDIDVDYSYTEGEGLELSVSSSLDDEIRRGVGSYLAGKAEDYRNRVDEALINVLDEQLERNATLYATFSDLRKTSQGNLADLDSYQTVLDQKKAELENRIQEIANEKAGDVLDSVKDKIKLPGRKN